jgi:hypothetical protein
MALEELVNPKGKYPRRKSLQIVFPKPVKHMKVNPSAIDRVKEAGKGLMGDVTIKEVAGGVGGVASTVLIPQYLKLKGWKDVAGSGAVAVGGGLLVRQADKGAGNAFILTGLAVTALKGVREIVTYAKGKTSRTRKTNTNGKLSAIIPLILSRISSSFMSSGTFPFITSSKLRSIMVPSALLQGESHPRRTAHPQARHRPLLSSSHNPPGLSFGPYVPLPHG